MEEVSLLLHWLSNAVSKDWQFAVKKPTAQASTVHNIHSWYWEILQKHNYNISHIND